MKKKKVLILGGAGFIGFGIAKRLVERGIYDITIADLLFDWQIDSTFKTFVNENNIKLIKGDFTDPALFKGLDKDYDYCYFMAAVVGVNRCLEHPEEVITINAILTLNVLEWLKQTNVNKVVFASSSECYAGTTSSFDYKIPTDEAVPLCVDDIKHPRFTYAVTKMFGESAFLTCADAYGFDATVVRYQNAYGPRMGFKHAIPHIIERFIKGESPFRIYGYDQTRAFCYLSDSAEGTILAVENDNSSGEIYHIGTDNEITIEELVKNIGQIFGYKGNYTHEETYPGSVSRRCPDISKAKKELGYSPKVSLIDGLTATIEWYKDFFSQDRQIHSGGFVPPEGLKTILDKGRNDAD